MSSVEAKEVTTDNNSSNAPNTPPKRPKIRMKVSRKRKEDGSSSPSTATDDSNAKKQRLLTVPGVPFDGGLSPSYGVPEGVDLSGLSPSYGMSPSYGLSPSYGYLSPSKPNPYDLGGVLKASILQMLQELSPNNYIETNIICVTLDTPISLALDKLADHKILAMPVVDSAGTYLDIIDNFDIMRFITSSFTDEEILKAKNSSDEQQTEQWHHMTIKGREILKHTIKDLIGARKGGQADVHVTTLEGTDSVSMLLRTFLRNRMADGRTYHRLVLLTPEKRIRAMVSQSDILRYLFRHEVNVRPASQGSEKTLKELGLTKRRVAVVRHNASVLYSFYKMAQLEAHSIAVTKDGKLIRHFSASDLRGFTSDSFPVLLSQIQTYTTRKPATLVPSNTLWEALSLFAGRKLHRCCIVDPNGVPFSLVSIANLLAALMKVN